VNEDERTNDLNEGFLQCDKGHRFPIIEGVLILVADFKEYISQKKNVFEKLVQRELSEDIRSFIISQASFVEKWSSDPWENLAGVYTWVHFDDIMKEKMLEKGMASIGLNHLNLLSPQHLYTELVEMLPKKTNPTLPSADVGCSVGRLTHELASKYRFAIGIDHSFEAVRIAREITQAGGRYEYDITLEGLRKERRTIDVRATIRQNVDFIVSDATNLPFESNFFETILAANMVDVVPYPMTLLKEIHRTLRTGGYLVTCDPYCWTRASSARPENWIGGKDFGTEAGESSGVLRTILKKRLGFNVIKEKDLIPWPLRYDQRHICIWLVDCLQACKRQHVRAS
jgi:SAM-dependent methyltransferase